MRNSAGTNSAGTRRAGTVLKIALAALVLAGTAALTACGGPKVFNYGDREPNITVEQA